MKKLILALVCIAGSLYAMDTQRQGVQPIKLAIKKTVSEVIVIEQKQYRVTTPPLAMPKKQEQEEGSSYIALSPPYHWGHVYGSSPEDLRSSNY